MTKPQHSFMRPYRHNLPPLPPRMAHLPRDIRGYPVPWFVAFIDGEPDFRVIRENGITDAIRLKKCWLCGEKLGRFMTFVIGPMCVINRTTSEPPCHHVCADYAVHACPFMVHPKMKRDASELPEGTSAPAGVHLDRNPGAMCLWTTQSYRPFRVRAETPGMHPGLLIEIGEPETATWWKEGRPATQAEVMASVAGGYPHLRKMAEEDGAESITALDAQMARFAALLQSSIGRAA